MPTQIHVVNAALQIAPTNVPCKIELFTYIIYKAGIFKIQSNIIHIVLLNTSVFAHGKNIPREKIPSSGPPVIPNTDKLAYNETAYIIEI